VAPPPIVLGAQGIDLTSRFAFTTTVAASPSASSETVIATLTALGNVSVQSGVYVYGWAAYTVGGSGTAVTLQLKRTSTGGAVVATTGALNKTAASLYADDVQAVDTGATVPGQVYVLTMTVTGGVSTSTVSAVMLNAVIV